MLTNLSVQDVVKDFTNKFISNSQELTVFGYTENKPQKKVKKNLITFLLALPMKVPIPKSV
jgi:hypothetical protein